MIYGCDEWMFLQMGRCVLGETSFGLFSCNLSIVVALYLKVKGDSLYIYICIFNIRVYFSTRNIFVNTWFHLHVYFCPYGKFCILQFQIESFEKFGQFEFLKANKYQLKLINSVNEVNLFQTEFMFRWLTTWQYFWDLLVLPRRHIPTES